MDYEFALREYPRLEGKDVVLRRFTLGDAGDVFEYASDPEVTEHLTWESHGSIEETISVMKKIFLNNPFMYAITLPENEGFTARYSTMSGGFRTDFPVSGLGGKKGQAVYGSGKTQLEFSSTSGSISVKKAE